MTQPHAAGGVDNGHLWYKDAIIYELHVKSYCDSDADGIGDFPGLTSKLDYLQDLGVTAIWLLPFYPSPLRDDGYDIADYYTVHPSYGTLDDFRTFLDEAHARGLRVITELVINHTSDQNAWFKRARRAPKGSVERDFYVWSDTAEEYSDARVIFKDFEQSNWSWDPVAQSYYWHRFYSHQPDLNFENNAVQEAVFQVLDFWLDLGVDGLRLDAIPYLYEEEGTNCENLARTHVFLKKLRARIDERHPDRMLLAEANQWPEDAVAYFGQGDECHMCFHFPVMPRMFMALRMEDRTPIIDILDQTPTIPDSCQWAMFLRNHDELTLEMVTDEERDYMYRSYAQDPEARINLGIRRRLSPLLGHDRRRIELMNCLLMAMPGTPVLYYGDEIGLGDNMYLGDRHGVRTPMQWSSDRNAGFSRASPHRLYLPVIQDGEFHYQTVNVETQSNNPHSLLAFTRRLIALRKRYAAFSRGTIAFLHPENRRVLVFVRRHDDETILVVANLSRFVQAVELDLPEYAGYVPVELFGQTRFPAIGELPYFLTLGPHSFYMFSLTNVDSQNAAIPVDRSSRGLISMTSWATLLHGPERASLERWLPGYLRGQRWFGGKARTISSVHLVDDVSIAVRSATDHLTFLQVDYTEGESQTYLLPLALAVGEHAEAIWETSPSAVVVRTRDASGSEGVLYDALVDAEFASALLGAILNERRHVGRGIITGKSSAASDSLRSAAELTPRPRGAEQSNSSIVFGDVAILKVFRRVAEGENPDLEIGRMLTERTNFTHTPALLGALDYRVGREPYTIAMLQSYVANYGDAWEHTLGELEHYFELLAMYRPERTDNLPAQVGLLALSDNAPGEEARDTIAGYLESAALLGRRTAEMHQALASDTDDPSFAPEPISPMYQRSIYQSMRGQFNRSLELLSRKRSGLPPEDRALADSVVARADKVHQRLHAILQGKIGATRIRCHGDFHLGQVLYTGSDFVVIDFEGEPARSLGERRIKRSPLRDVAGMIRSFDYAASTALARRAESRDPSADEDLESWARYWYGWVAATYLRSYRLTADGAAFLPRERFVFNTLLQAYLLEKALYELEYELNNRPTWVAVPLRGILRLID